MRNYLLFLLTLLLFPFLLAAQTAETPIVQAVLFYSPSCPHCHQVINELLLPMQETYGEQLQIAGIDTTQPAGSELYGRAVERYEIPENRLGVPMMIIADTVLVGGREIPDRFPQLVEEGLASGGIGWPDIPDLTLIVPDLPPSANPADPSEVSAAAAAAATSAPETVPTAVGAAERLEEINKVVTDSESAAPPSDPAGFMLAWVVLLAMIAALFYAARRIYRTWPSIASPPTSGISWLVPLLALLGLGVASYLAYVEVNHVEAVCGPVGECNIVQSSPYAQLFGIPIAIWGVLTYLAIIALWAGQRFLSGKLTSWSVLALVLLTVFGTLFSIYLTLLELFAIKAICLWCLSSAVLTTSIMVLVVRYAAAETRWAAAPAGQVVDTP